MLKQYPPFVASLHVTVRIEPLSRAIDVDAAFEKLTSGLECGALEAVRGTCWKGYSITIDKRPPAPEGDAPKVWIDPAVISTTSSDSVRRIDSARDAAYRELIRQHQHASGNLRLPRYESEIEGYDYSSRVSVGGILDVSALADAIRAALEA